MEDNFALSTILEKWSQHTIHQSMHGFMHFMREHNISYSQISVLYRIFHHGPTDIISLSRELQISKAGAGQLVDRMLQAGWLIREPSPTDKRSKIITLTPEGRNLVHASQSASMAWINEFTNQIPATNKNEIINGIMPLINVLDQTHNKTD